MRTIVLVISLGFALFGLVFFVGVPLLQHMAERQLYGGWTRRQMQELEQHQRMQRIEVAQEQVRLQREVDRCLSELRVEIAQERSQRHLEAER
jgi:cytochrome c oxidase assembly protein Cox11